MHTDLQATIGAAPTLPPQAVRAWTTASMLLWLSVGTVALIVVALLFLRARSRTARPGGKKRRARALVVDPWVEAGRRAGTPPDTRPGGGGSVSGDEHGRSGGMP